MAETLSYQSIRSANQAREADEQKAETRKKNLLILVLHYLSEEGYLESAQTLSRETSIDLNRFEVCDNVDLQTVLMEYESYHFIKFSKYPKITKFTNTADDKGNKLGRGKIKRQDSGVTVEGGKKITRTKDLAVYIKENRTGSTPSLPRLTGSGQQKTPVSAPNIRPRSGAGRKPQGPPKKDSRQGSFCNGSGSGPGAEGTGEPLALQGLVLQNSFTHTDCNSAQADKSDKPKPKAGQIIDIRSLISDATKLNVEEGYDPSQKLLKPLAGYVGYNSEWRELAQVISREIYSQNPNVRWDDIIGLDNAKRLVKEAVVYPIKYPQLFTGILSPWKGLLLYGPPGTGKTLLAKAVATECDTTFFNISASSIVSKWRGDSEKLVRVLFELARYHAPSTIFLDELESLMSQRGSQGGSGEHEGSRRMKTELLVQMDGLAKSDDLVFLLAASNIPWELDLAMLRRLEKRILVNLPTYEARKAMFKHHLPPVVQSNRQYALELQADLDYDLIAKNTDGYSGADVRLVCKEAAMRPVRKVFDALENHTEGELHIELDTIRTEDVEAALTSTKPSARNFRDKYTAWQKEYESV